MIMRRFTKAEDRKLTKWYGGFVSVSEIAKGLHRAPASIYTRVELLELERDQTQVKNIHKLSPNLKTKIKEMHKLGLSLRAIAREFNLSHEGVRLIIKGRRRAHD